MADSASNPNPDSARPDASGSASASADSLNTPAAAGAPGSGGPPGGEFLSPSDARILIRMLVLAAFSSALMLTPVNVAVPQIMAHFGIDAVTSSWLPLVYLIAVGVTVVPAARIAERVGRAQVFRVALACAALGSLLAALTMSFGWLLAARVVQGIGAGMCFSVSSAMVAQSVPPRERGEKLGVVLTATYLGLTFGPFLGGLFTQYLHWRLVLALPVPLLLASFWIAVGRGLVLPKIPMPEGRFDFLGALLYGVGMTLFILGVSSLPGRTYALVTLVGVVLLVIFVRHGLKVAQPIFNVRLFVRNVLFARSCLASVLMYAAIFSTTFVLSILLQEIHGLSALNSGLMLTIQPLVMATLSKRTGRWSDVVEPRFLASGGLLVCAFGLVLMGFSGGAGGLWLTAAGLLCTGLGVAAFSAPNHNAIMGSVARSEIGAASSALAVMRILGQMLSMVCVACVFSWLAQGLESGVLAGVEFGPDDPNTVLTHDWLERTACLWSLRIAAVLCLGGALVSFFRGDLHARA